MSDEVLENTENTENTESSADDDELLASTEEEIKSDEQEEESDETKEGADEDEELESKEDEDEEEELKEVKVPFDRPTVKEIKAKYPDLFKDFPQLRDSYFRELQYTGIFPTIEDAKEAFDDNESFSQLRESALSGNPEPLLDAVDAADQKALKSFSLNFLPSLYKKNAELYRSVTTPVVENILRYVHAEGLKHDNEDLINSALNMSKYLFNTDEVATGKKTFATGVEKPDPEKQKQTDVEQARRLQTAYETVQGDINRSMKKLILADFDPEKVFTPFMRRQLVDNIISRIGTALEKDTSHMKVMANRWKRADINGYSDAEKTKIVAAYLARAKSLIPTVRAKVRAAALGTANSEAAERARKLKPEKKEITGGRPGGSNGSSTYKKVDYNKLSDLDILNS